MERIELIRMFSGDNEPMRSLHKMDSEGNHLGWTEQEKEQCEKVLNGEPVNCKCADYETMENFKTDK